MFCLYPKSGDGGRLKRWLSWQNTCHASVRTQFRLPEPMVQQHVSPILQSSWIISFGIGNYEEQRNVSQTRKKVRPNNEACPLISIHIYHKMFIPTTHTHTHTHTQIACMYFTQKIFFQLLKLKVIRIVL